MSSHFLDLLSRKINLYAEYVKIERIICSENDSYNVNDLFQSHFREWQYRQNFDSIFELREAFGFVVKFSKNSVTICRTTIDLNEFLLYCEMVLNLYDSLRNYYDFPPVHKAASQAIYLISYDINELGYRIYKDDSDRIYIIKNDPVANEIIDTVPEKVAANVLQYSHYAIAGDLEKKRTILKTLGDYLEPKRKEIRSINTTAEDSIFFLLNKMNIRHNNCDIHNTSNYNEHFVALSDQQKEKIYDDTFQQALTCLVLLNQRERTIRINKLKNNDYSDYCEE